MILRECKLGHEADTILATFEDGAETTKRDVRDALEALLFNSDKIDVQIVVARIHTPDDENMHRFAQCLQFSLTRLTTVQFRGYRRWCRKGGDDEEAYIAILHVRAS